MFVERLVQTPRRHLLKCSLLRPLVQKPTHPASKSWTLYISQEVSVDGESEFRIVLGWLDSYLTRSRIMDPLHLTGFC